MAKLYVIAGHGAGDSGACGNGYTEAERVRVLAKRIKALGGSKVVLGDVSRNFYKDNGISRLTLDKDTQILELHMDSNTSKAAKGAHVIIKAGFKADAYDKALEKFIKSMFPGRANTMVGRSDLANVNRAAAKGYGYRLLECGFISNKEDVAIFNKNIDKIAEGILEAFKINATNTTTEKPASKPNTSTNTYKGDSIVDYLESINKDSSFAARKKYAIQYGIKNYTGTASQNTALLNAMRGNGSTTSKPSTSYYKKYTGTSIQVDTVLKAIGVPAKFRGSWSKRKPVATKNGISNYTGTTAQNEKIISLAKQGKLKKV